MNALYKSARLAEDPVTANDLADQIQRSVAPALEASQRARLAALEEEGRRLRAELRASLPAAGSYKHELAAMRGRR